MAEKVDRRTFLLTHIAAAGGGAAAANAGAVYVDKYLGASGTQQDRDTMIRTLAVARTAVNPELNKMLEGNYLNQTTSGGDAESVALRYVVLTAIDKHTHDQALIAIKQDRQFEGRLLPDTVDQIVNTYQDNVEEISKLSSEVIAEASRQSLMDRQHLDRQIRRQEAYTTSRNR